MAGSPPEPSFATAVAPPQPSQEQRATSSAPRSGWRERWRSWRGDDTIEQLLALTVCGVAAELFWLVLSNRFWLTKFFPNAPYYGARSVGFPQMMSGDWAADARWLALVLAAPFVAFVIALWYARSARSQLALALVFAFAA